MQNFLCTLEGWIRASREPWYLNSQLAFENSHRNRCCTHETWWFSIIILLYWGMFGFTAYMFTPCRLGRAPPTPMPTSMKDWRVFRSHHQSKHLDHASKLKWTKGCCPWRFFRAVAQAGVVCTGRCNGSVTRHSAISLNWERHWSTVQRSMAACAAFICNVEYTQMNLKLNFIILLLHKFNTSNMKRQKPCL